MGSIILQILRPVVIWCVQLGLTSAAFTILEKILDALQEWVRDAFDISDTDSKAVIANYMVDALTLVGTGAAVIYSKAPISLAKKIGLGNRTATKVKVPDAVTKKVETATVSTVAKLSFLAKLKSYVIGNTPTDLLMRLMLLQQMGDWYFFKNGMVMDILKSVFGNDVGDEDAWMKSPGPFSAKEFDNYVRALESQNVTTIVYPVGTFAYSRSELAKLVSWVYGKELSEQRSATAVSLPKLISPYLVFSSKTTTPTPTPTPTKTTPKPVSVPKVQVFTGVISQGTLGQGLTFEARPNDMIDNVQELVESASINLANFLTALPSRVIYEVKIVSTITTKDGFTQRGTTTQVVTGYYANGSPKYKTVTNKFAVLYLYLMSDKNSKTKIATINVGPVNSANFQVSSTDLTTVANSLQGVVTTSDVSKITTITTPNNIGVQQPTPVAPAVVQPTTPIVTQPTTPAVSSTPSTHYVIGIYGSKETWTDDTLNNVKRAYPNGPWYELSKAEWDAFGTPQQTTNSATVTGLPTPSPYPQSLGNPPATTAPPATRVGANANTLAEWYAANGQSLPTVSARSILYQDYGLGSAALYIGSAEQNTRLLDKLKGF